MTEHTESHILCRGKPGPGVLLMHQANRDRKSWDSVASQLASAGINTLTLDMRGHGESGGKAGDKITDDIDKAFQYLVSQPGVNRDVIGAGGAGWLGVGYSVEVARQHAAQVKSLVLLSGETLGGTRRESVMSSCIRRGNCQSCSPSPMMMNIRQLKMR